MLTIFYVSVIAWIYYVVVQFYSWFKFYFLMFQTHYHILPYPKPKENTQECFSNIESCLLGDKVNEEMIRPQAVPSLLRATRSE